MLNRVALRLRDIKTLSLNRLCLKMLELFGYILFYGLAGAIT